MQMKKPAWSAMPVMDVRLLPEATLATLGKSYDELAKLQLAPIAQLDADKARQAIDAAICTALELPDLQPIRELLAREPGLSAERIGPAFGIGQDS